MRDEPPIVVVGAGPAGVSAARTLVGAGHRPILVDEGMFPGGQVFRRPPSPLQQSDEKLYGFDARRARRLHDEFAALLPSIVYHAETMVWAVESNLLHLARGDKTTCQPWKRLILATGAMDRIVPTNGWTAPGVVTLGAAQIALKAQASIIGKSVIFLGSGPLLYLVAYQYARAGARVVAVLEAGRPFQRFSDLPALASGGATFARGVFYIAWLKAHGVPIKTGIEPLEILHGSDGRTNGLRYRRKGQGRETILSCDALAIGYGLKSETQLADLLGVDFHFDPQQRQWLPTTDLDGRSCVDGVYLAGDGVSIRGNQIAAIAGELAALALLSDMNGSEAPQAGSLRREISRARRFRRALDSVFAFPTDQLKTLPDEALICRCEGLTAGAVRDVVGLSGESDINRVKAFSRLGMGRCQGRVCGPAAAELIAAAASTDILHVGRLRGQAPLKPIALATLAGGRDEGI
ncbi:NADPH-dependent 2,4-dienoyl-CoA reductase/sulfur reductase-like enzyme [Mycoplana sp. BE70]|uniref:FAD/NAD(P)-dependent oxidoreductase n=1 Tax=Mycoplana sp. BE70 TaxID=2817775 RepID=UPI002858A1A1|nr:FAD/NAD(P)-binding oxidoreductase [Mycoplana sp. BE70]MDR6758704.1 NADPH-dependent 2,4-dienoyl-CoA reductase/sulfur reductase-like enzyme [Mycoplana sp. BE70]